MWRVFEAFAGRAPELEHIRVLSDIIDDRLVASTCSLLHNRSDTWSG